MKNNKRHSILRVRKVSLTERGRLSSMVIPDKKKEENRSKCRQNDCWNDDNYDYHDFDY
jgi:hypothetical protein